jgi:hypothetical protein
MTTQELVLRILEIAIPTAISIMALVISWRTAINRKKEEEFERQPIMTVTRFALNPKMFNLAGGEKIYWCKEKFNRIHRKVLHNSQWKSIDWQGNLFINMCQTEDLSRAVIAFNAMTIELEFTENIFDELKIKKVYSMREKKQGFGRGMKINAKFPVFESKVELPITYAYIHDEVLGSRTSLRLREIYKYAKWKNRPVIDFLTSRSEAGKYIGFIETGYLIECRTTEGAKKYEYSVLFRVRNETFQSPIVRKGSMLFDKVSKEASSRAGFDVVQYAVEEELKKGTE